MPRKCIALEARQPDNPQGRHNYHQDNSVTDNEHECSESNPQRILDFSKKNRHWCVEGLLCRTPSEKCKNQFCFLLTDLIVEGRYSALVKSILSEKFQ
jgi:hypothetical protein